MRTATRKGRQRRFPALFAALALSQAPLVLAQECEIGELKLRSQTDVDNFQQTVGGGTTCRILIGELIVEQEPGAGDDFDDPIVSLDGLKDLVEVQGIFGIVGNGQLEQVDELVALERVEGRLVIAHNRSLVNLGGLAALQVVDGSFEVSHNRSMVSLEGLAALQVVEDEVRVSHNPSLVSLEGLGGLVGFSHLRISDNRSLTSLQGLEPLRLDDSGLQTVRIDANASLENIEALAGLEGPIGGVHIAENPNLDDLRGLEGIVSGNLYLGNNGPEADLSPFGKFTGGQGLALTGMPALRDLDALGSLQTLYGLTLSGNANLEQIDALGAVEASQLSGITIGGNPKLRHLDGLRGKMAPDVSSIRVVGNDALQQVDGLSGVNRVFDNVAIRDNPSLRDLDGLSTLERIIGFAQIGIQFSGDLRITGNSGLTDCTGLARVLGYPTRPHDPRHDGVGRNVVIDASNGPGARSPDECLNAYAQSVNGDLPDFRIAATGSWYDPATVGEGFYMFTDPNQRLSLYYFGYDDNGENEWLIAFSDDPWGWRYGEPIPLEAFEATGGAFNRLDPEAVDVEPWGAMTLTLDDCDSGRLAFSGPPGDKVLDFTRLATVVGSPCNPPEADFTGVDSVNGAWFELATAGQGFTFHHVSADRGMVTFFGYRDDGSHLWLVGVWEEPVVFGQTLTLEMLAFSGGAYEAFDPEDVTGESWGELRLRFDSCTTAKAVLDGRDGQQTLDLQLLAGAFGLPCTTETDAASLE